MKRFAKLGRFVRANSLSALAPFEGDYIAYELSSTQHFSIMSTVLDEVYVPSDAVYTIKPYTRVLGK